jgi:hypothetical protein
MTLRILEDREAAELALVLMLQAGALREIIRTSAATESKYLDCLTLAGEEEERPLRVGMVWPHHKRVV